MYLMYKFFIYITYKELHASVVSWINWCWLDSGSWRSGVQSCVTNVVRDFIVCGKEWEKGLVLYAFCFLTRELTGSTRPSRRHSTWSLGPSFRNYNEPRKLFPSEISKTNPLADRGAPKWRKRLLFPARS